MKTLPTVDRLPPFGDDGNVFDVTFGRAGREPFPGSLSYRKSDATAKRPKATTTIQAVIRIHADRRVRDGDVASQSHKSGSYGSTSSGPSGPTGVGTRSVYESVTPTRYRTQGATGKR